MNHADNLTGQTYGRNNRWVMLNGVNKTITTWAREIGVSHRTLAQRLDSGWSTERALTTPPRRTNG